MRTDMTNRQGAASAQGRGFYGLLAPHSRWRLCDRNAACSRRRPFRARWLWARVQRQYVGDRATGMLFSQGVISRRKQSFVKRAPKCGDPPRVKVVENAGLNACPVMNGHGSGSSELHDRIVSMATGSGEHHILPNRCPHPRANSQRLNPAPKSASTLHPGNRQESRRHRG